MTVLDIIVLLFLVLGALIGFKKGFIKTMVSLIGMILVIVISFYLKNPIANFAIEYFPFFEFGGFFEGLTALNILMYETIAFLLVFVFLSSILGIIINITGIIEKLLNLTVVLGFFSKILGAIAGVLEMLVIVYIALFALSQFSATNKMVMESKVSTKILARTPVLSNGVGGSYNTIVEIYSLHEKYAESEDKKAYNIEAVSIMLKYDVVDAATVQKAIDKGKLDLKNVVFY